jgi:hypothetical protein
MNDDLLNKLLNNLIEINKEIQIHNSIQFCKNNRNTSFCHNVINPDKEEEWKQFYTGNNYKNLFAKGRDRFDTLTHLLSDDPILYFKKKEVKPSNNHEEELLNDIKYKLNDNYNNNPYVYFYIISALIIIFQVFGDGNHRTAQKLMTIIMGYNKINETKINDILKYNDYDVITNNPIEKMYEIIDRIIDIANQNIGGKKRKKTKRKRKHKRRQKSKKIKN